MDGLILGVNTLYRLFCFFKLFPMVGKGLKSRSTLTWILVSCCSTMSTLPAIGRSLASSPSASLTHSLTPSHVCHHAFASDTTSDSSSLNLEKPGEMAPDSFKGHGYGSSLSPSFQVTVLSGTERVYIKGTVQWIHSGMTYIMCMAGVTGSLAYQFILNSDNLVNASTNHHA